MTWQLALRRLLARLPAGGTRESVRGLESEKRVGCEDGAARLAERLPAGAAQQEARADLELPGRRRDCLAARGVNGAALGAPSAKGGRRPEGATEAAVAPILASSPSWEGRRERSFYKERKYGES